MIHHPNRVSIAPTDGSYGGDFWAYRAVAHPGLLWVPRLWEDTMRIHPGIEAPINEPPQPVVDAYFTNKWNVVADISSPAGIGISVSETIGPSTFAPLTVTAALQNFAGVGETWQNGDPPDAWISLGLSIEPTSVIYYWTEGKWWPGISIFVNSRAELGDDPGSGVFYQAELGRSEDVGDPESGLSVNFGGHQWMALGDSGISGSITIEPEDYLLLE